MNLRQKAKKYKQRIEQLEKMCIPIREMRLPATQHKIITLETSQIMDMDDYYRLFANQECYASRFNKIMAGNLVHEILNYAEITNEPFDYNKQIVRARMQIVDLGRDRI